VAETRCPDTTFWVDPGAVTDDRLTLDAEESKHLLRVHRAHTGTPFEAVDGEGTVYGCVLDGSEDGLAVGRIERRERDRGELGAEVHLLVGIPDLASAEIVVEHAVPLGATTLDFVACARSGRPELGPSRLDRLARLARSAIKQSRRTRLPRLLSSVSLEGAVSHAPEGQRLVADPGGRFLGAAKPSQPNVTLAIGPPGGFADPEIRLLRAANFQLISLGPSRLTTETAAITLLAAWRNCLLSR
jgi:16S rRNA (uracil1498-N3)-methyltransferase